VYAAKQKVRGALKSGLFLSANIHQYHYRRRYNRIKKTEGWIECVYNQKMSASLNSQDGNREHAKAPSNKEKDLPVLGKTKFLVPQDLSMSQFVTIIRYKRFDPDATRNFLNM